MTTKLRLKKKVWQIGIPLLLFIGIACYIFINFYKDYQYKQTFEYKLIKHGYSLEETKELLNYFDTDKIEKILEKEKNSLLISFIKEKYYIHDYLEKYLAYATKNKKKSNKEIIALVNTHRDEIFYEEIIESDITKENVININKYYKLPENFEPLEITTISPKYAYAGNKLAKIALHAYINMWNDAKENGFQFIVNTSYRSYDIQKEMYENTKSLKGAKQADLIVARPGHSDHQSGLSIDLYDLNNSSDSFQETPAYQWLQENAYKFGFIERYPKDKESITGFSYEPWHWRYVGVDVAKIIKNENITFDEYYAYYIEKKN